MPVYKSDRSPFWITQFECFGRRVHRSTKATTRREAEGVERALRAKIRQEAALTKKARTSLRLDDVGGRYWDEVGKHHAGADNTWRHINYLVTCPHLGKDILITDITDDHVTKLVAWCRDRRIERKNLKPEHWPLVSPFTVNDTTEQLKKLFTCAKLWGVRFEHEPKWKQHWLDEPQERVRELVGDEHERLQAETRDDYEPFFAFAHATGMRLNECLLRWSEVDWNAGQIRKPGKGGKLVTKPITPTIRAILWPLRGHHPAFVFTYVAERTRDGRVKGERYPLTYSGVKITWRRLRTRAGVVGFRFHDFRHDLGTKVLRKTGNLKLVQKALNHADLKTTSRYAHVLDDEVAAALEDRIADTTPPKSPPTTIKRVS
jgi:integrase